MATVGYTASNPASGIKLIVWTSLTTTNLDGTPFIGPQFADRSVQVTGAFSGATLQIQGTNFESSETWTQLTDPQGNPIGFTSAGIEQVMENTYKIRPLLIGGTGSTDLTIHFLGSTPTSYELHVPNSP